MSDRIPTNTTREMRDPGQALGFLLGGGGVVAQERQGQAEMVNSTVLPSKGTENIHDLYWSDNQRIQEALTNREKFEALGFVFGELVEGDDMFIRVTLPEGWSRKGSEHQMWSYVHDERGLPRVSVFYKAAFYDRSAHCSLLNVGREYATKFFYGNPTDSDYIDVKEEWWPLMTSDEMEFAMVELEAKANETPESWWNDDQHARKAKAQAHLDELRGPKQ